MSILRVPLLLVGAFLLSPVTAGAQETLTGGAQAVEGDLITVDGTNVRLYGIDAPDFGQQCENVRGATYDCFDLSRRALDMLIGGRQVTCEMKKGVNTDVRLAVCRADGQDLAAGMAAAGYALAYRRLTGDYVRHEARAMSHRRGLWAGRVEPPWLWRSRELERQKGGTR